MVDVVIFRQNTEGLYGGVEWSNPPQQVYDALMTHSKFRENFGWCPKEELAVSTRIFTKKYTERIVRAAFEHAVKYGYKSVTVCEKPNVIRETSGLMWKIAKEMQKNEFPAIQLWNTNIDAQMMWLTKNPEDFGVILRVICSAISSQMHLPDLSADSDLPAAPSLEDGIGVFEPTTLWPKYAGYDVPIVNPVAMIESACMMLDYIEEKEIAAKIRRAIAEVIEEGRVKTYDMMKMTGKPDVVKMGAASTIQMTDAIIARLK